MKLKVGDIYTLNVNGDNTITYQPFTSTLTDATYNPATCSCNGFVRELRYRFYITPRQPQVGVSAGAAYGIDEILVDFVLQT
jgi:hypothetical protein